MRSSLTTGPWPCSINSFLRPGKYGALCDKKHKIKHLLSCLLFVNLMCIYQHFLEQY